jgi:hypothetical protein
MVLVDCGRNRLRKTEMKVLSFVSLALMTAGVTLAQSPAGTWTLYPPQANVYTTQIQQPINADGTSTFKATGKSVIPVKFGLTADKGPVMCPG